MSTTGRRTTTGPSAAESADLPIRARITVPEEDVARIGFGVAAPQHVEVVTGRHPTCWGVDARNWIRATASERAFCRYRRQSTGWQDAGASSDGCSGRGIRSETSCKVGRLGKPEVAGPR